MYAMDYKTRTKNLTNSCYDSNFYGDMQNSERDKKLSRNINCSPSCFDEIMPVLLANCEKPLSIDTLSIIADAGMEYLPQVDFIDEIDGPLMPPKREFKVMLHIKSINKGRPSICNDIEYW